MTQIRRLCCWLILACVSLFERRFQIILFWRLKVLVWQFWLKMQYENLENLQYLILAKAQWSTLFVCDIRKWCSMLLAIVWAISLLAYEISHKPYGRIIWWIEFETFRFTLLRPMSRYVDTLVGGHLEVLDKYVVVKHNTCTLYILVLDP